MLASLSLLAIAAVMVLLMTGCGAASPGTTDPSAAGHPGGDAIVRLSPRVPDFCKKLWHLHTTRLRPGFRPAAIYQCVEVDKTIPGRGTSLIEQERVVTAGLDRLVRALERPNQRGNASLVCADNLITVEPLAVRSDTGVTQRPTMPTDGCGQPQAGVMAALSAAHWSVVRSTRRDRLTAPH